MSNGDRDESSAIETNGDSDSSDTSQPETLKKNLEPVSVLGFLWANKLGIGVVVLALVLYFTLSSNLVISSTCGHVKFEDFTPHHTACLTPSKSASKPGVGNPDKVAIVNQHNDLRAKQRAVDMQKLAWDEELAFLAQKWADNCQFKHEDRGSYRRIPGKFSSGQNMAVGQETWSEVITQWYDEIKDFTYGEPNANELHVIGHYTQLVWASSNKIGCGFSECEGLGSFFVCDYGPTGNYPDFSKPYKAGEQCAECPSTCDTQLQICDCGGKSCYNGGTLNLNTCQCECKYPEFHLPDNCQLNCTGAVDLDYLCKETDDCLEFDNIPDDCPKLCNTCPYGGFEYLDSSWLP